MKRAPRGGHDLIEINIENKRTQKMEVKKSALFHFENRKLDGRNYPSWKFKMRNFLKVLQL